MLAPTLTTTRLLDRLTHRRADADFLATAHADPAARFLVLAAGHAAVIPNPTGAPSATLAWLPATAIAAIGAGDGETIFLGMTRPDGAPRFAIAHRAPPPADADASALARPGHTDFASLRTLALQGSLPPEELSLAAQALTLANWHADAAYCGRCGSPTEARDGGWKRICRAPSCAREIFPRIDPVVMMLVVSGDACVLAREPRFPEGMYSTLAGFIEPGEDIAHAVERETLEEIGLKPRSVAFVGTQPWPFPHSLMIGCIAECDRAPLTPAPDEITDARWFAPNEVEAMLAQRHPENLWLPRPHSLAHILIRRWLEAER